MANKILPGRAEKQLDGGAVQCWCFVYELCKPADVSSEAMTPDPLGDPTVWYTQKPDLVTAGGNMASISDISVDDGGPATVAALDPEIGKVTLQSSPSGTPTATYKYANERTHQYIKVDAAGMTDPTDATEAKNLANAEAQTARTTWLNLLASETTTENTPSLEGEVSL